MGEFASILRNSTSSWYTSSNPSTTGTILAQGAQGSVTKNRNVYLSGEGVIGETWFPPQELKMNNAEKRIRIHKRINLTTYFLNTK
jgi:hypothetical protein